MHAGKTEAYMASNWEGVKVLELKNKNVYISTLGMMIGLTNFAMDTVVHSII